MKYLCLCTVATEFTLPSGLSNLVSKWFNNRYDSSREHVIVVVKCLYPDSWNMTNRPERAEMGLKSNPSSELILYACLACF